ncbi:MAG TPA: UvrD-helicase domain-containing protein [Gammaproteobacteria bacterium]|nr:UvrD-helicase domain-containing protein [Gammaproteobacteria bacterium]
MDSATDAMARRDALDPERSFIVQAPAGSGKTELLTQRYLRMLAIVGSPEQILAITFTRKAVGEMRDRVLQAIAAAADDTPPPEKHRALTWKLARAVRDRAAAQGWQLVSYPSRLRIETLDAFAGSLTRRLPLTSGLGAAPRITERARELYAEAARRTVAMLDESSGFGDAVAALLLHLDNNTQKLEQLLIAMLAKRDQWLRLIHHGGEREFLEAALAREVASHLALLCAAAPAHLDAEMIEVARAAACNLSAESNQRHCRDLTAMPGTRPADLAAWQGLAATWQTKDKTWRKSPNVKNGFPPDQKELKQRANELLASLAEHPEFCRLLGAVGELPPVEYSEQQWTILQALIDLLKLAAAQLQVVFGEQGSVDFIEIALRALRALGEPDAPTDLGLALDYRLQHILVDEFQDTSWSQFALLERLTAGWSPGDGRTLFLVGDPMQSIYRFREAKVGLYLRAWHEGIGDIRLDKLKLGINFRSTAAIVDWNNATFAALFPAVADIAAGAVPYAAAIGRDDDNGGGAEIIARFDDSPDEAARIVELVEARRRAAPDETIGILVRGKKHAEPTLAALREAGFRAQAVDLEPLGERQTVRDLTALTRALAHPGDRVAWLAILRAPWCGLSLTDLTALAEDTDDSIWTLLNNAERMRALSAEGRERAARVIAMLAPAFHNWRRQPLRQLVEETWLALGGPACIAEPADLDNADAFFALLDEVEQGGDLADNSVLEERLADLCARPAPDADARLQVMTIHKAKGLEFDTVIVPALERVPKSGERQLLLWLERPRAGSDPDFLLAPIASAEEKEDALYNSLKTLRKEQDELEQMRLLYVAATRARRRLYLLGGVKSHLGKNGFELQKPNKHSLLAKLWPQIAHVFEAGFDAAQSNEPLETPKPAPIALSRLVTGWQTPPPPRIGWRGEGEADVAANAPVEFSWAGETARRVGVLVHALLDRIARDQLDQWPAERVAALGPTLEARLRWEGVPTVELEPARDRVIAAVKATLADERGRWLLAKHDQARTEYALSGMIDGRRISGVIDRSFVEDGVRWIVDYKTGSHEGGDLHAFLARERERYAPQMATYARLFAAMEDRVVRTALYFPLMAGWIEWES